MTSSRSNLAIAPRLAWWALAVAALALTLAALPGYLRAVQAATFLEVPLAERGAWSLPLNVLGALLSLAGALLSLSLAALLFWRRADDPMALFVSVFLLLYAVMMCGPLENLTWLWPGAMDWAFSVGQPLFFTVPVVTLLVLFPNGRPAPPWSVWLLPLSAGLAVLVLFLSPGWVSGDQSPPVVVFEIGLVVCALAGLYAQIDRYRRISTPAEQRQVRWVLYGVCVWGALLLSCGVPWLYLMSLPSGAVVPWWAPVTGIMWNITLIILPLSLAVAVLRYRLYAIDRLIRRTLLFSMLTASLTLIYLAAVGLLQLAFRLLTGQSSPLAIVASTLAIAALFAPLRRRVQSFIDRRLFRTHYDTARTLDQFGAALRDDTSGDLARLAERLEGVIDQTMQPESVWLWLAPPSEPRPEG